MTPALPPVLTVRDVAGLLRLETPGTFYRWRPRLEAAGFPRPLPGCGQRLRWSREAILGWLVDPQAPPRRPAEAGPAGGVVDWADELDRRAALVAAGAGR